MFNFDELEKTKEKIIEKYDAENKKLLKQIEKNNKKKEKEVNKLLFENYDDFKIFHELYNVLLSGNRVIYHDEGTSLQNLSIKNFSDV
jgi:hypothetical protein